MGKTFRLSGESHGANRDSLNAQRRAVMRRRVRREALAFREGFWQIQRGLKGATR